MSVRFRNVGTDPGDDVETWPYEAVVTAIERGTIGEWVRLTTAIDRDPWGEVAAQVAEHVANAAPYGVGPLLERAIERARRQDEHQRAVEDGGCARRAGPSRTG